LIYELVRWTIAHLPVDVTAERAASHASNSHGNPTHITFLFPVCFVKRKADRHVTDHSLAHDADPLLGLGVVPILGAVSDQVFRAATHTMSVGAALVPVRFEPEFNRAASAFAQSGLIDGVAFRLVCLQVRLSVGGF
jgi:hypothetical protein